MQGKNKTKSNKEKLKKENSRERLEKEKSYNILFKQFQEMTKKVG